MLGICVLMNLTWAVISQERASLSGLKGKTFKNVPTSSSTLFGVLVEDYENLHEFGEDLTGFEECCTSPQMIPGPQMIPDRK